MSALTAVPALAAMDETRGRPDCKYLEYYGTCRKKPNHWLIGWLIGNKDCTLIYTEAKLCPLKKSQYRHIDQED